MSIALAIVSTTVLISLWIWTAYHLIVFALGWTKSRHILSQPFQVETLRNPVDLPRVTIIVAAKNEESVIGKTLENVLALRYPKELLEILVAEDGSTDRTRSICEALAADHSEIVVLHADTSHGKAAALNRAAARATGDLVLFLDADSRFERGLLLKVAKFFHDHPEVHAAQAIINTYSFRPTLVAKLEQYETILWYRGILAGRDRLDLFVPLCGTGMFIKKSLLERIGGWNGECLAEDIEMAIRIMESGTKVRVLPAQVWRQPPYSVQDFVNQRKRYWGGGLQILPRALRLVQNPRVRWRERLDILMQLAAPFAFIAGTAFLLLTGFSRSLQAAQSELIWATFSGIIASQIVLVGFIVVHAVARRSPRDLDLVPGVYVYWAMQLYAILTVMVGLARGRPPSWKVTAKRRETEKALGRREKLGSGATFPRGHPATESLLDPRANAKDILSDRGNPDVGPRDTAGRASGSLKDGTDPMDSS